MSSKVAKNYIYNFIYQIAVLIIPLITAPYLARILGSEGIGVYSYHNSIAYYFAMFAMLGMNNHGNRSIARCLGNRKDINRVFSEMYCMQMLTGITVLIAYVLYSILLSHSMITSLLYIPFVLSYVLDVNWYFFGQERFKVILVRNIIIKILTAVCIFTFVRTSNDVNIYIIIMGAGLLLSQILVWILIIREAKFVKPKFADVFRHLKTNLVLFIPVISVSIYRTMDKIMLGNLSDMNQVGFYENAEKIVSIMLSFITALGTIMLPRMSALYAEDNKEEINSMLNKSIVFISCMAAVVSFGISSISEDLVVLYYGKQFVESAIILRLLCITIPCISYANIIRMQILVPTGRDKIYVGSCITGAVVNLIINALLIPVYLGVGAAIGTIMAELSVWIVQLYFSRDQVRLRGYKKSVFTFWLAGLAMFVCIYFVNQYIPLGFTRICIQILVGAAVFVSFIGLYLLVTKDSVILGFLSSLKRNRK